MSCCLDVNDEGENRGGIVSISGIISPSFPSLGDWRTWSQTRLFQAVSITHRREEERRVSLKINTFPDKCHNLNELPPVSTNSPMSPWCPNSRRSYLTGQIQAPSLWEWHYRCTEGPEAGEGWRYWWHCCIVPRPGAIRSSLLKESMIMCSSAWPPRREPKP